MRNRLLIGATVAALSLAAVPATAQVTYQRDPDETGVEGSRNPAYDEGYRSGEDEGQRDARERKDYGFKRDDAYEDADRGYYREFGSRDAYRDEFRRGYEVGYDRGYRRFGFGIQIYGGSANEYGPYGYPERGYGAYAEWGYGNRDRGFSPRAAFDAGRRDGYEEGFRAARDGRWDWRDHRYYRSTRGYDRRFGSRDAYDLNYRNGFRTGYEQGYRDGRRSRRW
jgi:hypothetical protein